MRRRTGQVSPSGGSNALADFSAFEVCNWLMNETESGPLVDTIGAHNLILNGTPSLGNAPPNALPDTTSVRTIASGDFLYNNSGFGKTAGQDWTMNFFFAIPSPLGNVTFFSWGTDANNSIALSLDVGNKFEYYERASGASVFLNFDSQLDKNAEDGNVHMLSVSYSEDEKAVRTYFDGKVVGIGQGNDQARVNCSALDFRFGNLWSSTQHYLGYLQRARYWAGDGANLSASAIAQLWDQRPQ